MAPSLSWYVIGIWESTLPVLVFVFCSGVVSWLFAESKLAKSIWAKRLAILLASFMSFGLYDLIYTTRPSDWPGIPAYFLMNLLLAVLLGVCSGVYVDNYRQNRKGPLLLRVCLSFLFSIFSTFTIIGIFILRWKNYHYIAFDNPPVMHDFIQSAATLGIMLLGSFLHFWRYFNKTQKPALVDLIRMLVFWLLVCFFVYFSGLVR